MARTRNRRWKGCRLCKPHKDARHGDAYRMPVSALRQFGRSRRVQPAPPAAALLRMSGSRVAARRTLSPTATSR
jgi:hypothetical protein